MESSGMTIYPNPFNNTATVSINETMKDKNPSLIIYNLLGQEMKTIFIGANKSMTFSRDNLAGGMYFYKLVSDKNELLSNGKIIIE